MYARILQEHLGKICQQQIRDCTAKYKSHTRQSGKNLQERLNLKCIFEIEYYNILASEYNINNQLKMGRLMTHNVSGAADAICVASYSAFVDGLVWFGCITYECIKFNAERI